MIKGLIFDYGGTIDTNGVHWGLVLKKAYDELGIIVPEELFFKAYQYGERSLALQPLVKPNHNFYDVLSLKIEEQIRFMSENNLHVDHSNIKLIADFCYQLAKNAVQEARKVLAELYSDYPMVIVSNFYGNLNAVLEYFDVRDLFLEVIESAVVGIRKPDPLIYQLGVDFLSLKPEECMVIGDSFSKDIVPAKEIGCHTIWLNKEGLDEVVFGPSDMKKKTISDFEITDFSEILNVLSLQNLGR